MRIVTKKYNSYSVGSLYDLHEKQVKQIMEAVNIPVLNLNTSLNGRCSVNILDIEGIGSVAIKHYIRGGLIHFFNKNKYLKIKKERSRIEFEWLYKADKLGISVPEPVAFVSERKLFYKCWLITRAVKNCQTLASLSLDNSNLSEKIIPEVAHHVGLLIQNKILHIDLHPGNILVNNLGQIFIIDFDNAVKYSGNEESLCKRYIARWERAVKKHRLPEFLAKSFKNELKI
jgi:3-deoxy-D-manno-octulosonic acid kinase